MVLSAIEQSIKRKIEAVGKPLKEWDIQINYGIKTGCNEAFVITTQQRKEILASCRDEAERARTEALIRPILRGRDIKRYSYDWAELYLIATFPAKKYDIELYPAVKDYLLAFGLEKLEQTGKTYIVNGESIKARKKTNNKWFEVQDSIAYWEDFDKPKIMWKIIGNQMAYTIDREGIIVNNACYLMTGEHIEYLVVMLNSDALIWYSYITNMNKTGMGDVQVGKQNVEIIPIPENFHLMDILSSLLLSFLSLEMSKVEFENKCASLIAETYSLTEAEVSYLREYVDTF